MTRAGWEPTTEAEVALYEALLAGDQERYFRVLARVQLLLPVSADAVAGRSPMGWATWTSNDHTHLLAFTSPASMRTCLAEHAGAARRMPFAELASVWPNHDWWLAINPGLPIEGYLPAWFVAQLSQGDSRLPGQAAPSSGPRDRLARVEALERAKAARAAGHQPPRDNREPVRVSATVGPRALPSAPPSPPSEPYPPRSPSQPPWHDPTPATWQTQTPPRSEPVNAAWEPAGPRREPAPSVWEERREPIPGTWTSPAREPVQASWGQPPPAAWRESGAPPPVAPPTEPVPAAPSGRRRVFRPGSDPVPPPAAWREPREQTPPAPAAWQESDALAAAQAVADAWRGTPATAGPAWREPVVVADPTELPRRQPGGVPPGPPAREPAAPTGEPPAFWRDSTPPAAQPTVPSGGFWNDSTPPAAPAEPTVQGSSFWRDSAPPAAPAEPTVQTGSMWRDSVAPAAAEPTVQAGSMWRDSAAPAAAEPTVQAGGMWRDSVAPAEAESTVQAGSIWGESHPPGGKAEPTRQSATSLWSKTSPAEPTVQTSTSFWSDGAARASAAEANEGEPPAEAPLEPAATTVLGPVKEPMAEEPRGVNGKARHAEPEQEFVPANTVEQELFDAAEAGNTDAFLSTLLLATVLIPKAAGTTNGAWRPQPIDGEPHIVCYTSTQHLAEHLETVAIKFIKLIQEWPDPTWSFAVNPGTPVGATLPGGQLLALANWAAEVGLGGDDDEQQPAQSGESKSASPVAGRANPELTVLQKAIAASQVSYYLDRGYDRVSGFVHRAHEVGHLKGIDQMRAALGLDWPGSPFTTDATEIYLLRWSAYRPNLYRIPYGGNHEAGMKAMQGWVIERAPFRGNGFAPGENKEIIAEFKVDSARLPHGARLMRLRKDGVEEMIAVLDADGQRWLRTDGG